MNFTVALTLMNSFFYATGWDVGTPIFHFDKGGSFPRPRNGGATPQRLEI